MPKPLAQIGEVKIRQATSEDAAEIANVQINSWREAYRNLIPKSYLDDMPMSFRRRQKTWARVAGEPDKALFVAETPEAIVGFAIFSASRDPQFAGFGELQAMYLFEKFHKRGIGAAFMKQGMAFLLTRGFTKAHCWVLENNPTIKFYEKSGAVFSGIRREDEVAGVKMFDHAYVWNNLDQY